MGGQCLVAPLCNVSPEVQPKVSTSREYVWIKIRGTRVNGRPVWMKVENTPPECKGPSHQSQSMLSLEPRDGVCQNYESLKGKGLNTQAQTELSPMSGVDARGQTPLSGSAVPASNPRPMSAAGTSHLESCSFKFSQDELDGLHFLP